MNNGKIKVFCLVLTILLLDSCNLFIESPFDREQRIINEYHEMILKESGKKFYFIPKNDILSIFLHLDTIPKCKSKKNFLVLFFDKDGNIIYQSKIYSIDNECKIKISCLDLETGEYYITGLSKDSIRGFDRNEFASFIITSDE